MILPYVFSQLSGAVAASLLLRGLFLQHPTLGTTAPAGSALQSLILEIILTALLMFVILTSPWVPRNAESPLVSLWEP